MKNDLKIEEKRLLILDTFESDAEGGNDEDIGKTSTGENTKTLDSIPIYTRAKSV